MQRCKAWEQLEDREYSGRLTMIELHELLLKAGWPAKEAQEAANRRGFERQAAGEAM